MMQSFSCTTTGDQMPTNRVVRTAGKIAGLAGLALAVFLLIFQGLIQLVLRGAITGLSQ